VKSLARRGFSGINLFVHLVTSRHPEQVTACAYEM
jgi:hypothetical protein